MPRLLVVSDLHVGPGTDTYDFFAGGPELAELLRTQAGPDLHLVLNGDTFDLLMGPEAPSLDRAAERMRAVLSGEPGRALVAGLRGVLDAGGRVTVRPGNHDLELYRPEVQALLHAAVGDGLELDTAEHTTVELGGVAVSIAHGDADDHWNRVDPEQVRRGEGFQYPPGSMLVHELLNPAKAAGLAFTDLLKPDMEGAALAALLVGGLPEVDAGRLYTMARRLRQRAQGDAYAAAPDPSQAPLRPELLALEPTLLAALESLLDPAQAAFSTATLGEAARTRLLQAALGAVARLQRWWIDDKGEAYFAYDPDLAEWEGARALAATTGARVAVIGHTHAARLADHGGLCLVNTGTWAALMRTPPPQAEVEAWQGFLEDLRADPGVEGRARRWRLHRFTGAELVEVEGGLEVRLLRFHRGGHEVLRRARVEGAAAAPVVTAAAAPATDLAVRCAALRAELDHWSSRPPWLAGEILTPRSVLDAALALARAHLDLVDEQAADGAPRLAALQHLADAHAALQLFRAADQARRDPQRGAALLWADAVALDGYQAGLAAAAGLGLVPAAVDRLPTPLVIVEPGLSPATYPRGRTVLQPGFRGGQELALPFPIVLLPPDHLAQPGLLATVLHEIGHDLDHDLGLREAAHDHLRATLPDGPRRDAWSTWLPELLADLLGLALGGPGYRDVLAAVLVPSLGLDHGWARPGLHPPVDLRLHLVDLTATRLGLAPAAPPAPSLAAPPRSDYRDDAPAWLDALWQAPVGPTTVGAVLARAARATQQDWRRLPGRVQREAGDDLATTTARFHALAAGALPMPWALDQRHQDFLHARARRQAPTWLDRPGSLYKTPPLPLLVEFDEADLVGATQGQLAPRLEQAHVERGGRRWKRLHLWVLDDEALARTEVPGRPFETLRAERDAAVDKLRQLLPALAEVWAIYTLGDGSLYASVWRRQEDGCVRWHVHTSARVWGQDIRSSPSTDFRSTTPDLSGDPEIRVILAGLETIRDPGRLVDRGQLSP